MTSATTLTSLIQPASWLGLAYAGHTPTATSLVSAQLITMRGRKFPRTLPTTKNGPGILVVVDGGNGALKIAVLLSEGEEAPRLFIRRVEVCYALARQMRTGITAKHFTVNGGTPIRIGNPSVSGAKSVRTGSTAERMSNDFSHDITFAAIADTLVEAGYAAPSGTVPLYFGYVVPTDEFVSNQLVGATETALRALRGQTITVERTDKNGTQRWPLHIENTAFAPQTQGVFYAMQRGLFADVVLDGITKLKTLDIGFGHEQILAVEFEDGEMVTSGGVIGKGMVLVAERLIELVQADYGITLNDAQAQYALITNTFDGGKIEDISALVDQAVSEVGEILLQSADKDAFTDYLATLVCSGGGTVKMAAMIEQRIAMAKRREGSSLVLPASVAAWANVVGGYAFIAHELMRVQPWKKK